MGNIVRCSKYLRCKALPNEDWDMESECIHWPPHEFIETFDALAGEQGDCYGEFCDTIKADAKCMPWVPESVDRVDDDQLTTLAKSVRRLGRELVGMPTAEAALRVARDRMNEVLGELSDYLYNLTWDRAQEKVQAKEKAMQEAWERAGVQSEEDAEYG